MSFLQNQINALKAGYAGYRLALTGGPLSNRWGGTLGGTRQSQYAICWDAYNSALYLKRSGYGSYIAEHNLYPELRQIYSFVEDSVGFYVNHVYRGTIDDQGVAASGDLNQGIPLVADEAQKKAIYQSWQWARWGSEVDAWLTYGASCGDTFQITVDDVQNGKCYQVARAPWHVPEFHLDRGFVVSIVEEYPAWDAVNKKQYTYRREMDLQTFRTFKDSQPFDYDGNGSEYPNPYGFVPAVYTQHRFNPEPPGKPSFRGWRTLDEVNSLASRLNDYILMQADTPTLFKNAGEITSVKIDGKGSPRNFKMLQMAQDGTVEKLEGNLDIADAEIRVTALLEELRRVNPEITTFEKLRGVGAISGVAARRLLGDVEGLLQGPSGHYDTGTVLGLRHCLAIGGQRFKEGQGGWAQRTDQQRAFAPFDLNSYRDGDLNIGIAARGLIEDSDVEKAQAKMTEYQALQIGAETLGVGADFLIQNPDVTADLLPSLRTAQEEKRKLNEAAQAKQSPVLASQAA